MNHCPDQAHPFSLETTLTKTAHQAQSSAAGLRFLDLFIGGFDTQEVELKVDIPPNWQDQEIQALIFLNEAGRWVELPGRTEREGDKLRIVLPAGRLVHLAVALMPQYQGDSLSQARPEELANQI